MKYRLLHLVVLAALVPALLLPRPHGLSAEDFRKVTLRYQDDEAVSVHVVGSFNNWRPGASELQKSGKGLWTITLSLPPGVYQYMLAIDGKRWIPDPNVQQTVQDGFGTINSILSVD